MIYCVELEIFTKIIGISLIRDTNVDKFRDYILFDSFENLLVWYKKDM